MDRTGYKGKTIWQKLLKFLNVSFQWHTPFKGFYHFVALSLFQAPIHAAWAVIYLEWWKRKGVKERQEPCWSQQWYFSCVTIVSLSILIKLLKWAYRKFKKLKDLCPMVFQQLCNSWIQYSIRKKTRERKWLLHFEVILHLLMSSNTLCWKCWNLSITKPVHDASM